MFKSVCSALPKFIGRLTYRLYLALGLLLVTVVVLFTIFPQLPTGFHTALFVTQVLNIPVKPQSWFTPHAGSPGDYLPPRQCGRPG